jgi:hypothetical protein
VSEDRHPAIHQSETLWRNHHEVAPYPNGVIAIPEMIRGTAFFPGGRGVWQWHSGASVAPLPVGGIMVLGHDFHSEHAYRESLVRGYEPRSQPTWRQLLQLLDQAKIHPLHCFFTNVYMGLRRGSATTGPFPGSSDPAFVGRCLKFLRVQLEVFRPAIILTLGSHVPPLLARMTTELDEWQSAVRLQDVDARGPCRRAVTFATDHGPVQSAVVALTHPSHRRLNVARRKYLGFHGEAAELQMIADACATLPVYGDPPD